LGFTQMLVHSESRPTGAGLSHDFPSREADFE
jgi:hypothetical protein